MRYDDRNDQIPMRDVGKHNTTEGVTAEVYEDFASAAESFEAAAVQFQAAAEYMQERQAAMTERAAHARDRRDRATFAAARANPFLGAELNEAAGRDALDEAGFAEAARRRGD